MKNPHKIRCRLVIAAVVLASAISFPLDAPAQSTAAPANPTPVPSFEVATIKQNNSGGDGSQTDFDNGDRFIATNVTIQVLLESEAFDIAAPRILGGPKWFGSARFDIDAKLDPTDAARFDSLAPEEKKERQEAILQKLLADRFQFKSHWEDREQPVYALTVAKGGPRLGAADTKHGWMVNYGSLWAGNVTLARLAELLTEAPGGDLGRVVIDRTGISGTFTINLKWAPDTGAADSSTAPTGPSIFTAIQEQLGLKLEPAKAPVKVLVIDHLEMPSEN